MGYDTILIRYLWHTNFLFYHIAIYKYNYFGSNNYWVCNAIYHQIQLIFFYLEDKSHNGAGLLLGSVNSEKFFLANKQYYYFLKLFQLQILRMKFQDNHMNEYRFVIVHEN